MIVRVQVAKLLDVKDVDKRQYMFAYTLAKEGEAQRTVYQVGNLLRALGAAWTVFLMLRLCSEGNEAWPATGGGGGQQRAYKPLLHRQRLVCGG